MPLSSTTHFECHQCSAKYKLVRAEGDSGTIDGEINCRQCGAPLHGREGNMVLKYFLVDRPRARALMERVR